jgi:hypothetical protein
MKEVIRMSYTKAELEEKWHESRDLAKELTKEKQELQEDNLRLREENARLSALVDELNNCNDGLRARLKVIEVEMEATELEARSAALADEADALVESLPIAPVKPVVRKPNCDQIAATLGTRERQIQAFKARFEQKRAERKAEEATVKPELDPEPELEPAPEPEPIPEPEKAEVKELPVSTDLGAEKIIEITPNKEVVFEAEMDEVEEDDRVSHYHPYGEKKPSRVLRPSESRPRRGIMGRLSQLTEGELDDD